MPTGRKQWYSGAWGDEGTREPMARAGRLSKCPWVMFGGMRSTGVYGAGVSRCLWVQQRLGAVRCCRLQGQVSVLLPCTASVALSSACPPGALARHTYTPCAPCVSSGILRDTGHTLSCGTHGALPAPHTALPCLTAAPRPARCAGGAAPRRPSATPGAPAGPTRCRRTQPCCPPLSPGSPVSPARPGDRRRHQHHHLRGM